MAVMSARVLSDSEVQRIHELSLKILAEVGVVEVFRSKLCLFKMGMQRLEKVEAQVEAQQKIILNYA